MIDTLFYDRAQKALNTGRVDPFDLVGFTPHFLNPHDERDAVTQLNHNYIHGGGWHDFNGFRLDDDPIAPRLLYDGDPPTEAVAHWKLRDERIILFDHAWVAVIQPDNSFRVARMD